MSESIILFILLSLLIHLSVENRKLVENYTDLLKKHHSALLYGFKVAYTIDDKNKKIILEPSTTGWKLEFKL